MIILLLGKNGQLGRELQRSLSPLGSLISLDRADKTYCGDLTDLTGLAETVRDIKPDVIVNAAAYTAVDQAEDEMALARRINVDAVAVLAAEAKKIDARLIHYSTDYVFDGENEGIAWLETDATNPLNTYGKTKLQGEAAIISADCKSFIFRTSWVYSTYGRNFAKTMLRLAQDRDSLSVINDQFGAPTSVDLLADITAHAIRTSILQPHLNGVYHAVAAGEVSWYGYAYTVLEYAQKLDMQLKVFANDLDAVQSDAFPTAAQRPKNSRLNTQRLQTDFNLQLPDWRDGVIRMLDELLEKQ